MRRRAGLALLLAALAGTIVFLHRLSAYYPLETLRAGPFELALGTAARLVGLVVAYWLLASALLLILARVAAIPAAIRAVSWITWPPIRKLVEGTVASSLVLALSGPAGASVTPGYVPVPAGDPTTTTTTSAPPLLAPPPAPEVEPAETVYLPIEVAPPSITVTDAAEVEVVVRPGDHMWLLAERRLEQLAGHPVSDADIAPYWLAVIAANKDRIRSGDPDLIFPGEVLILPEWS